MSELKVYVMSNVVSIMCILLLMYGINFIKNFF